MELDLNTGGDAIGKLMDTPVTEEVDVKTLESPEGEQRDEPEVVTEEPEHEESTEESSEEPSEEPELVTETKYKVKVNGEEREVTLQDLLSGHMMQADYTRKTQELAQKQKEIEANPIPDQFKQKLTMYENLLGEQVRADANTDWVKLARENPAEYIAKQAEATERARTWQEIETKRQNEAAVNFQALKTREQEQLFAKLPTWKDEKVAVAETQRLKTYLQSNGYKPEEVENVLDHRAIVMADKASKYDALMASKSEVTKKVEKLPPKMEKPGAKSSANANRFSEASSKLKKTGSLEDAVAAFDALF